MSTARKVVASIGVVITLIGLGIVLRYRRCTELDCMMVAFGWYTTVAGLFIVAASTIRRHWKKRGAR